MLGDNLVLAIENRLPIQLRFARQFNAVLLGVLEVVIDLGIEKQCLCGDAAYMQAGSTQLFSFFDQGDLQPKLACANSTGISGRTAPMIVMSYVVSAKGCSVQEIRSMGRGRKACLTQTFHCTR